MRISKTTMAVCMLFGSFFLYCGQSAMSGNGDGGPVGDANGQSSGGGTCCTPPPQTFKVIATGDFLKDRTSPAISTAGYRDVVVYVPPSVCQVVVSFRADSSSAFFPFQTSVLGTAAQSERITVQGSDLQLAMNSCSPSPANGQWVVAGVSN